MTKIIFLGTSCMLPTVHRNHPSIVIEHLGKYYMFDCGENTQRQMRKAKLKPSKLKVIFISHWHGDHVFGLPGILQTLNANLKSKPNWEKQIYIIGPEKTRYHFSHLLEAYEFNNDLNIKLKEINKKQAQSLVKVYEHDEITVKAINLNHTVHTLGFLFKIKDKEKVNKNKMQKLGLSPSPLIGKLLKNGKIKYKGKTIRKEQLVDIKPGKRIAIMMDTALSEQCYKLVRDADIVVIECTYLLRDKDRAEEYKHLTTLDVVDIAKHSNAKVFIITHLSQRYAKQDKKDSELYMQELQKLAKKYGINKKFIIAHDFFVYDV